MMTTEEQRKRNVRLGLILGSVAVVFFVGFIVRMALLRVDQMYFWQLCARIRALVQNMQAVAP